jgi:lipopolysaccharide biosynthesis glycosyltransferase
VGHLESIHNNFSVRFVKVSGSEFSSAPEPKWFNEGIYYRLLINSLLPIENENVLYIDCDTIVDGSLSDLFNISIDSYVAAGVPEPSNKSFWIDLPADAPFYNTGVMYINLKKWEDNNIEKESMEFIKENSSLTFPLQQILNTLLHKKDMWKSISPEYNAMVGGWIGTPKSEKFNKKMDPKIIHYYGSSKPWEYVYHKEYTEEWWGYLEKTPYKGYEAEGKNWKSKMVKSVDTALEPYPKIHSMARCVYTSLKE